MKSLLLITLSILTSYSFAMSPECKEKLKNLMVTPSEKYLFKKHLKITEIFGTKCEETPFGDRLLASDSIVFIHEAAHFEDLNWGQFSPKGFDLYTVDAEHIGGYKNAHKLPQPQTLINSYIEKNKPEFLDEESVYMSMHEGYLLDSESAAASHLPGLASELNGYTHGSIIQARNIVHLPDVITMTNENGEEMSFPNYAKIITQLDGLMYFLYNHNLYLRLLKSNHPELWSKFYNEHNKNFLRKLLKSSIDTLAKVDHCKVKEGYNNVDFYIEELRNEDTAILVDLLGAESVNTLLCSDLDLVVNKLDLDNSDFNNLINEISNPKRQCS